MASFALNSIVYFFVAVLCFIAHNVEARDGKFFFSKFTHIDHSNNKEVSLTPVSVPAQAPSLAEVNGRLGDGEFGPGSGMIPQSKKSWPTTTTDEEEFEKLMAKFDEKATKEEFDEEDQEMNEQKKKYNNYNDNERGYGHEVERQEEMSDRRSWNYENAPSRDGNPHPNEYDTMEEYYKTLEGGQDEYEP